MRADACIASIRNLPAIIENKLIFEEFNKRGKEKLTTKYFKARHKFYQLWNEK